MNEKDKKIIKTTQAYYASANIEVPDNPEICRIRDEVWIRAWGPSGIRGMHQLQWWLVRRPRRVDY
jgi:hypothetical protein